MVSPAERLKSIIHFAKELLSYSQAGGDKEHAFNLVADSKALAEADDALDSMLEALKDKLKEEVEVAVEQKTEIQLSLLKEVASKDSPKTPKDVVKLLKAQLKGREVNAFGAKSEGLYGSSKATHAYKIAKVESSYNDGKEFVSLDLHLGKYDARKEPGLIYTDKAFLNSLRALVKALPVGKYVKSINYSEHGMQGNNYVNLDVTVKL